MPWHFQDVEGMSMKKTLLYAATAIALGLATIVGPTMFLVGTSQQGDLVQALASFARAENTLPLLDYSEQNHVEAVSSREVAVLGISFAVASVAYILFRRKIPRRDHTWPLVRPF